MLGEDGRTKTGRSGREIIVHEGLNSVLCTLRPRDALAGDFVFRTPRGAPIDEANFQRREWLPAYVSTLLAAGAKPLFVCRQTGTSLEMIEKHYGNARVDARRLAQMIGDVDGSTRNPPGTPEIESDDAVPSKAKEPVVFYGLPKRAGDRGRTGDVQLGKLIDDGPEDYDPWA